MPERSPAVGARLTVTAVALCLLTGCVGIPSSSGVHIGKALPSASTGPDDEIRVFPPPPRPGATPQQLVTGFLQALVSRDAGYAVARDYLAPGVAWHPSTDITMYDANRLAVSRNARQSVSISAPRVGTVSARGAYVPSPGTVRVRYSVVRFAGQWRIAKLPSRVLLSTFDVQRSLRPATVYFLNRDLDRLVPEQLLLNVPSSGLATTLVKALLAGPDAPLSGAARTAVAPGTPLLTNVPVDRDGVAQVNLAGAIRQEAPGQLIRLSAQLVWTLRQLPGIRALQLLVEGRPINVAGVPSLQPLSSWAAYDPDAGSLPSVAVVVRAGRVAALAGELPTGFAGQAGVVAAAISLDLSRLAVLRGRPGDYEVATGPASGPLVPLHITDVAGPPGFDPHGDLLVPVRPSGGSPLRLISPSGRAHVVTVPPALRNSTVSAVRVSRDGARIALVVGGRHRSLQVGLLVPVGSSLAVRFVHLVIPARRDVSGVAWTASNQVVTTGRLAGDRRALFSADPDGYRTQPLSVQLLPSDVDQVAAAPGHLLASNGRGVWTLLSSWRRTSTGTSPTYTG